MLNINQIAFLAREMGVITESVQSTLMDDQAKIKNLCYDIMCEEADREDCDDYDFERDQMADEIYIKLSRELYKK